ncbi:hypothetical protein CF392_08480 [Tamilnaduibacter salinus]|uniref:Uncharacterized protein n=1 Tax=Tamilnaduibacter salinus TaxID=1484056 RepID=A0A2A2I498_9GAMM|nr:hypothetical protein [Tamilnaduibacter salinus]PAV25930.1 hypothetical protein CF392_08480 [Tamilnaduibacter salinus]
MVTPEADRTWLMDHSLLRLVHQCRRLIQSEFGVKLHLTDDDLEHRLAQYARQSRSRQLQQLWERLLEARPTLNDHSTDGDERPHRVYRGRVMPEPEETTAESPANNEVDSARTRTITYRGRKIEVPV